MPLSVPQSPAAFLPARSRQCMLSCLIWLATAMPASAAPFAYFSDTGKNNFTVVDMANFNTVSATSLGANRSMPTDTVVNQATRKIFIGEKSGVLIIDATTNSITGEVLIGASDPAAPSNTTGVIALAVSPDGQRVFALSKAGSITVIDPIKKTITGNITVDPSSRKMTLSRDGETLYVSSTGFGDSLSTVLGVAGVTVIDALDNSIERVVSIGKYFPTQLAVHPTDGRIFIIGRHLYPSTEYGYLVIDPDKYSVRNVELVPTNVQKPGLASLAFNENGSRVYMSGSGAFTRAPLLEIDTTTGAVLRSLSTGNLIGDNNTALKLTSSFANGKFDLVAFLTGASTRLPYFASTKVVFIDVQNGTVLKELQYSQELNRTDYTIAGDVLDPPADATPQTTSTILQGSANPPLRRTIPLRFYATVTGNNPTGKVVFKFVSQSAKGKQVEKVRVPLTGNMATLALPACDGRWGGRALRKIICGASFSAVAIYRGDANNARSRSTVIDETY